MELIRPNIADWIWRRVWKSHVMHGSALGTGAAGRGGRGVARLVKRQVVAWVAQHVVLGN